MIKVVLDTNLFVAAYWNRRSASSKIIDACLKGNLQAYYTRQIEKELWLIMRNIRAKEEFTAKVTNFIGRAELVENVTRLEALTEDPDDQKFLECAVTIGADYLITSDDHLLRLRSVEGTEIIKPGNFWRDRYANRGISEESKS
ncbi:MAG TPA: putative toxin-antitoxin system toxin component, PIN family [Armatimonadota bacterium]|jgi:putative PIN family toxin of toxin-antitoxin system|nr:putative toxin-antitoxin system toxin component, PIN family [Armatimonadota bacterium]